MTSNLPAKPLDPWTKATDKEKLATLAALGSLPSRPSSSPELDSAGYFLALDGVTLHGLTTAAKAILQGSLQHAFYPSPSELRMQCDEAMKWHERRAERLRVMERSEADKPAFVPKPDEARAKVASTYQSFCEGYRLAKFGDDRQQREAVRRQYGMTLDAVSKLPDAMSRQ
jgi:hypothetical protein